MNGINVQRSQQRDEQIAKVNRDTSERLAGRRTQGQTDTHRQTKHRQRQTSGKAGNWNIRKKKRYRDSFIH